MISIIDVSPNKFYEKIQNKDLFLFGAGRNAEHFYEVFCRDKMVKGIVDNNELFVGQSLKLACGETRIIGINEFVSHCKLIGVENVALLVVPVFWGGDIIEQLDKITELDGLCCYLGFLLRNNSKEKQNWQFSSGERRIPKKIHYVWMGDHNIPSHLKKYIDGWKEKCPNYEIICWNESNYDFRKNNYTRQAYENKKWGFVSDYARLDILYENGGIYLDTDVELLRPLDDLLMDDAFMGFCGNDQINIGSGIGAIKQHQLIKDLRDYYHDKDFIEDEKMMLLPCYRYQHPVLKKYGFVLENKYQKVNNVVIYPSEVLSASGMGGMGDFYTEKSIGVHHTELSWISEEEEAALKRTKKILKEKRGVL